jgi:uracil-DNA glycosylase family 4
MVKRKDREPHPSEGLLFGDIDPTMHVESFVPPPDDSLENILADVQTSHTCGACKSGMPMVFGAGPERAEVMLIGEGPGVDDAPSGLPFQGQSGLLLIKMMTAIDVALSECYVCNVIKCIPPGERIFSFEEIEDCRPFLLRQILVVNPRIILAFGALAAQTLLRSKKTISELRGRTYTMRLNDREITILPTFNPAYLLRVAEKKREAWEDLKSARGFLRN